MKNNLVVVVGLGVTGLSCVRYLKKQGKNVAVIDSRKNPPGLAELQKEFSEIKISLGGWDEDFLSQAEQLIVSPGVSVNEPAIAKQIKRGIEAIGDVELFARTVKKPVIAITGSNGKTTVTTLMGEMIKACGYKVAVCGNIGMPVLDWLSQPQPDYYVIELSSFQLETTFSLAPEVSVCLNVSPDHMDRYAHYEDYMEAKQRVYQGCQKAIVNWDEPEIWKPLKNLNIAYSFTAHDPKGNAQFGLHESEGFIFLNHNGKTLISEKEMKLKGRHHLQNALAVLAMGESVGLSMNKMLGVLRTFPGLPHRCQLVSEKGGISWYNDSKATNVGAAIAAIQTLGTSQLGKIILLAGGDAKGADLSSLKEPVKKYVHHVLLYGKDADLIEKTLQNLVPISRVKDLSEAVHKTFSIAKKGDIVLLSPACASYDMFKNFEHRGDTFVQLIKELPES